MMTQHESLTQQKIIATAQSIAAERDWPEYVLNECKQMAKGVGAYNPEDPGKINVRFCRNGQEDRKDFGQYEPANFATQFVADLKAAIDELHDVTHIIVAAEVKFETEPTELEHIMYGISYDEYRPRKREVWPPLKYEIK
jgi:hypothetical protein